MTSARHRLPQCLSVAAALISFLGFSPALQAQLRDDPDAPAWQEAAVKPPPTFSTDQLQAFDVSAGTALNYGIDPKTLSVGEDGVVRYVLVARSSSGALNVLYQGLRCQTAEVKTYGRWNNNASSWNVNAKEAWQELSFSGPTRPAMLLARAGICEGRTINGSAQKILHTLKHGRPETR
ncbi:MAG: CNP1-like family protein [Hydrogenophaga sp.]|uniref:CNP1-like family protein n=1 Tax=Hydrogenophaga sp. TaxID=1904254 RepID=UPI0025C25299|nr:CNP1-like family protein [Hydrogenophaga sp.]MBU7573426.1 CNP1-like family protein [Hydrogenophaga sp.]